MWWVHCTSMCDAIFGQTSKECAACGVEKQWLIACQAIQPLSFNNCASHFCRTLLKFTFFFNCSCISARSENLFKSEKAPLSDKICLPTYLYLSSVNDPFLTNWGSVFGFVRLIATMWFRGPFAFDLSVQRSARTLALVVFWTHRRVKSLHCLKELSIMWSHS